MKPFFPKRLFWRFFYQQIVAFTLVFILLVFGLSFAGMLSFHIEKIATQGSLILGIFLILVLPTSALIAYRLASPLRRIIIEALRLGNRRKLEGSVKDAADLETQDERQYHEVERALRTIKRKLIKRKIQLNHEREESKALMGALEDAVVSFGLDDRIKFFNAKFAALFLQKEQLSNTALALSDIFVNEELLQLFHDCKESKTPINRRILVNVQGEASAHHFSVTVSPLRENLSQLVYGNLVLFHDITDLKRAMQTRVDFVANASHELRTPLTSIKGFIETIREDVQNQRYEQVLVFLDKVSRGANRMVELLQDMLSLSALDSNISLKKDWHDVAAISEEVISHLSPAAKEKKIEISLSCNVAEVFGDVGKIEQVLQNLVANAIKYIQEGGKISVVWQEAPQGVELSVIDNGPGIAPEHLGRLFERFYRVDKGRAREQGGTGLGLAIVKHIMQIHEGQASVHSELGQGCKFICAFPNP